MTADWGSVWLGAGEDGGLLTVGSTGSGARWYAAMRISASSEGIRLWLGLGRAARRRSTPPCTCKQSACD